MGVQDIVSRPLVLARPFAPRLRIGLTSIVCTLVLDVITLLVVYPVVLLVVHSFEVGAFGRETHWGLENWAAALTETQLTSAIWNTVSLAVTRQVIGLAL